MAQSQSNQERVKRWVNSLLTGKSGADSVKLWHATGRKGGAPVLVLALGEEVDPEDVATQLIDAAKSDADAVGGVQSYKLAAYVEEDDSAPLAVMPLRIEALDVAETPIDPSMSGVLRQFMQHNEALQRQQSTTLSGLLDHYKESLAASQLRVKELEAKVSEQFEAHEMLLSHQAEREMARKREDRNQARLDSLMKMGAPLIPALVSKLLGKKGAPDGSTEKILSSWMDTLSSDQMDKLMSILTPEQTVGLEALVSSIQAADEPAEGEKK